MECYCTAVSLFVHRTEILNEHLILNTIINRLEGTVGLIFSRPLVYVDSPTDLGFLLRPLRLFWNVLQSLCSTIFIFRNLFPFRSLQLILRLSILFESCSGPVLHLTENAAFLTIHVMKCFPLSRDRSHEMIVNHFPRAK